MKILIAEDTEDSRVMLEMALAGQGYEVMSSTNGIEALHLARTTPPDLIISDIMMPEMDGFELCRQIKANPELKKIPFIFYTATYTEHQDEELAMALGASRFIVKPIEPQELMAIIQEVLAAFQAEELPVSQEQLKEKHEIENMYLHSVRRKLDKKVRELDQERQALRESEHYNRMLFEQSPIGLALCRMNGELVDINPAFAEIIGRSVEETLQLTYWDITPEKYAEDEQRQLESLNKTGRYGPYEKEYIHKDGHLVPVSLQGLLLEKDGEHMIWSSVEDITERVSMEEALRRSQKMEAIGQLSGGIAHDFNNQLGIVIGYLDFLKNHFPEDEKMHQWVDTATRATLRCMDLTRQLLAFSRRQTKQKMLVDLNDTLKELETMIARSVTPEVEVQYFLADELWPTEIDPGEFQDAILNLVINARDAMPGGGKLLIETSNKDLDADYAALNPGVEAGDYVQLRLSDTGTGMDKETLERVFEPFFTTKPEGKGTGLGMAMVYGFAKRYGGHIKLYSEPGAGTTIRIYLPRSAASESSVMVNNAHVAELPTGNETILIVDDEASLLKLADLYLSDLGYRTRLAENAAQALDVLAGDKEIDLLFSDVVMPGGMNGYELAQQATEQRPGLKVLLASGFTSKTIAHNGLARFSDHLLSKPYRKADLAQRIRLVLDEETEI